MVIDQLLTEKDVDFLKMILRYIFVINSNGIFTADVLRYIPHDRIWDEL